MENAKEIVVTPSNVNGLISRLVKNEQRLVNLAVRGEITSLKFSSAGHCYFNLSDKSSKLSVIIWSRVFSRIGAEIEEGKSVICKGAVSVYETSGTYSLVCNEVITDGDGEQSVALDELVKKLKSEGVFDRKRPLPEFPKKIAVVTSPTGAVVHDIETTLEGRFPCVKMFVVPAVVQGGDAPDSIVRGIEYAQTTDADVIIICRGGGASEDLSAFNSERVARAIFQSKIPVISAVGHEIDITISDLAADKTVATPTAAAIAAVPDKGELLHRLEMFETALSDKLNAKLMQKYAEVSSFKKRMDELLELSYKSREDRLSVLSDNIKRSMNKKLEISEITLEKHRQLISALDPLSVLKRGYSTVKLGEKIISDAGELSVGDDVEIMFGSGSAEAEIKKVRE